MPGKDRLTEIVHQAVEEARGAGQGLIDCARDADHMGEANVDAYAGRAHEAIDRATDAARILVKEAAKPCC